MGYKKVLGSRNPADALTKYMASPMLDQHVATVGLAFRCGRANSAPTLDSCLESLGGTRVFALTTKGQRSFFDASFGPGDAFLLGPETRGLPAPVLGSLPEDRVLRLPLKPGNRSLNLANAAAVTLYEAWRQQGFTGEG